MKEIAQQIQQVYYSAKDDLLQIIGVLEDLVLKHTILMAILIVLILVLVWLCAYAIIKAIKYKRKHILFQRELREDVKYFYAPRK